MEDRALTAPRDPDSREPAEPAQAAPRRDHVVSDRHEVPTSKPEDDRQHSMRPDDAAADALDDDRFQTTDN